MIYDDKYCRDFCLEIRNASSLVLENMNLANNGHIDNGQ